MEESSEIVLESKKKPARRKYIIAAGIIFLCILAGLTYRAMTWEPKPDPISEKIIREEVAKQLTTDPNNPIEPNELTDEDFAKITKLSIPGTSNEKQKLIELIKLSDIKLLEKCTNLQELELNYIQFPVKEIPKWKKVLAKTGLFDPNKRFSLDLSPLSKLSNLQTIYIFTYPVSNLKSLKGLKNLKKLYLETYITNLKPIKDFENLQSLSIYHSNISNLKSIKGLKNLEELTIVSTNLSDLKPIKNFKNLVSLDISSPLISDLEPVRRLTNLRTLDITSTAVSNLEPIKNLTNLQNLSIINTSVSDLEPIKNLNNLLALYIMDTSVSDLEPIKELKNLEWLQMNRCRNITDEQVEELQKALPNLKFTR